MMELVERAIPVIQHPPEAVVQEPVITAPADSPAPDPAVRAACASAPDEPRDREEPDAAGLIESLAHMHRTLERLRTQHAQLMSGALLQQYQRQSSPPVECSWPATKVVSVQV